MIFLSDGNEFFIIKFKRLIFYTFVFLENFLNAIFGVIPFGISFLLMIKFYLILPSNKVNILCNIIDILKIILNSLKNGRG